MFDQFTDPPEEREEETMVRTKTVPELGKPTEEGGETTTEGGETTSEGGETTEEGEETTTEGGETTTEGEETTAEEGVTTTEEADIILGKAGSKYSFDPLKYKIYIKNILVSKK